MPSARFLFLISLCLLAAVANGQTITSGYPPLVGFVDISPTGTGTGTALTGVGDDTTHGITTTLGNALFPAGSVTIGNNGMASGAAGALGPFTNDDIPTSGVPNGLSASANGILLPFWDDLWPGAGVGSSTTIYWQEAAGVLVIMWKDEEHYAGGLNPVGGYIAFEIQVFSAPASGAPWIQYLYPDATFGGTQAANDNGASATIGYAKGSNALGNNTKFSFNTASIPDGTTISIFPPMLLNYTSPFGSGTLQFDIDNGPPLGTYYLAITLNGAGFPNGWFFGINPSWQEITAQVGLGFPFVGPLNGVGHFTFGPIGGVPPGLTIYSVALGFDTAVLDTPTLRSIPHSYVEP